MAYRKSFQSGVSEADKVTSLLFGMMDFWEGRAVPGEGVGEADVEDALVARFDGDPQTTGYVKKPKSYSHYRLGVIAASQLTKVVNGGKLPGYTINNIGETLCRRERSVGENVTNAFTSGVEAGTLGAVQLGEEGGLEEYVSDAAGAAYTMAKAAIGL